MQRIARELSLVPPSVLPDEEVVDRVLAGEISLFEILIRRYNQRVYRVARSIVRDETEAEDIMQDAYVRAFGALHQYRKQAAFSTWLTRIAVYEALSRQKQRHRLVPLEDDGSQELFHRKVAYFNRARTPEEETHNRELGVVLAAAVDALPESHRMVFVLREVEGMSNAETGLCLGISPENVRVRMHRARSLLKKEIEQRLGSSAESLFEFHLRRCDRIAEAVLPRLAGAELAKTWRTET